MNKKETDYQSAVSFDENYLWSFHSKIGCNGQNGC